MRVSANNSTYYLLPLFSGLILPAHIGAFVQSHDGPAQVQSKDKTLEAELFTQASITGVFNNKDGLGSFNPVERSTASARLDRILKFLSQKPVGHFLHNSDSMEALVLLEENFNKAHTDQLSAEMGRRLASALIKGNSHTQWTGDSVFVQGSTSPIFANLIESAALINPQENLIGLLKEKFMFSLSQREQIAAILNGSKGLSLPGPQAINFEKLEEGLKAQLREFLKAHLKKIDPSLLDRIEECNVENGLPALKVHLTGKHAKVVATISPLRITILAPVPKDSIKIGDLVDLSGLYTLQRYAIKNLVKPIGGDFVELFSSTFIERQPIYAPADKGFVLSTTRFSWRPLADGAVSRGTFLLVGTDLNTSIDKLRAAVPLRKVSNK